MISISEPYIELLPDNRLLCVYRSESPRSTGVTPTTGARGGEMRQCWSSDSGLTWTGPTSTGAVGVDPCLLQMGNDVLLCSYGRPDVKLMYSLDGGANWEGQTKLYTSAPSPASSRAAEVRPWSHAYTSMIRLTSDQLLFFFDIHEHGVPWTGRLPSDPDTPERRTNSVFAISIAVVRRR